MNHTVIINSIVILIVVCALAMFVFNKRTEKFVDDPNLQPADIQGVNADGKYCKRNLVFPNMNSNNFLASTRSLASDKVLTSGSCNIKRISNEQNNSYSIVHENYMYYTLRSACLQLTYTNVTYSQNGLITITFDRSSPSLVKELSTFILHNPIFVEFNVDSTLTSYAYFPIYRDTTGIVDGLENFTNEVNTTPFSITFVPILSGRFFEYNNHASTYKPLQDLLKNSKSGILNTSVFFLDAMEASAHNIRYSLPLVYDSLNGQSYLFKENFETLQNTGNVREYQFYKNVYLLYKYQAPAIFTLKMRIEFPVNLTNKTWEREIGYEANSAANNLRFAQLIWASISTKPFDGKQKVCRDLVSFVADKQRINIESISNICRAIPTYFGFDSTTPMCTPDYRIPKSTTIARVYMGSNARNTLGFYDKSCKYDMDDTTGEPNNNIFSIVAEHLQSTYYRLNVITGIEGNCNLKSSDPNNTFIDIPYTNEPINLMITISPYEKIVAAYWNSSIESKPNVIMSRRRNCTANNNFYKLFVGDARTESTKLSDIVFKYNTSFVKSVVNAKLGYDNLYNQIFIEKEN